VDVFGDHTVSCKKSGIGTSVHKSFSARSLPSPCGRMGVDFSPIVFDTWGGLHGAGKEVVKAMFARCTAPVLPGARPAAVGALRQGLNMQLGRSVARQLEALMMVSMEAPAW